MIAGYTRLPTGQFTKDSDGSGPYNFDGTSMVLPATGSGGGGGGGGAVTIASGAVASGAYASGSVASGAFASGALASGSVASGAMVDLGAVADAAATAGSTGTVSAKLRLMTTQMASLVTGVVNAAGSAIMGKVGIDQTTPGTTNGVQVNAAIPAGTNLMGKVGIDQTTPGTTNAVQVTGTLPALAAGSALVGKVGIDQTTPGTTNGVQVNAAIPAGTNLMGKVGIDQTTPGTTNKVAIIASQDGVAGGSGANGATVQRVTIATDDAVMGGTADAAATAGSTGSISAKLRAISRDLIANIVLGAGSNLIGKVGIDQTTPGTTNAVQANTAAATNVSSTAYEASHVIKASAGTLYQMTIHNSKASAQFIQLHNTTTVPADTAVPVLVVTVPASTSVSFNWGLRGRAFATGIAVCNSSTGPTKTVGSADCWFDAQFI